MEEKNMQNTENDVEKSEGINDLREDSKIRVEQNKSNFNNADFYSSKGLKIDDKEINPNLAEQFNLGKENPSRMDKYNKHRPKKIFYILAGIILLLGSIAFGYYRIQHGNGGKENIVQTEWGNIVLDVPQSEQMVNVLAIGFDKGGYRTDTMMIINFDPKTSKVNLISIPRDTLIGIKGKRMKLNAAFGVGKFDMTLNAIKKLTGLPIHYYVAVDTAGFKSIIDTLGGVQFDVPRDMKYYDPYQNLNIDLKKGPQLLNGDKAEQLVRYRKYVTGDLEREEVQKKFIKALIEQKLTLANASDVSKLKSLYDNLNKYVKTNATFNDGIKYFVSAVKIKSDSFKTYILPGQAKMLNGASYYIYDKLQTDKMISELLGNGQEQTGYISENSEIQLYDIGYVASLIKQQPAETNTADPVKEEKNESDMTKDIIDKDSTNIKNNSLDDKDNNSLNNDELKDNSTKGNSKEDKEDKEELETVPQDIEGTDIDGITYPESEIQ